MSRALLLLALAGCDRDTPVWMTGRVLDAPTEGADPVGGAELEVRDVYALEYATATAESDGAFAIEVPAGQFFTVMSDAEGYAPTSLSGVAGAGDFAAGDGRIWVMPDEEYEALFETWSACPTVSVEGGVAVGQALIWMGEDATEAYAVSNGTVTLYAADGSTIDACYLDEDGAAGSTGLVTGSTGQFAVFGAPEGASSLLMSFVVEGYTYGPYQWPIWIPGDGVAPLYPAYVELE